MGAQQLDLLAALDPTPPPAASWTPAPPPPTRGPRGVTEASVIAALVAHLDVIVPLHMADMATWTQARRRRVGLPAGWSVLVGHVDSVLFLSRTPARSGLVRNVYARGLAAAAGEPGGASLFGGHWCYAAHPGCPVGRPTLVVPLDSLIARCQAAIRSPDWWQPLEELRAAEGIPGPRPVERRAVPRTRRPVRAPRVVDVPTGGVL